LIEVNDIPSSFCFKLMLPPQQSSSLPSQG